MQNELGGFARLRAEEDAWTPDRQHAINLARHDQSAQFVQHRGKMQVRRRQALCQLFAWLKGKEADVLKSSSSHLFAHPRQTRPIADEQKQHQRMSGSQSLCGIQHRLERMRQTEIAGIHDDEPIPQAVFDAEEIRRARLRLQLIGAMAPIGDDLDG